MTTTHAGDDKFVAKYNCKTFQAYEKDPDDPEIVIPPPGHALHDADGNTTFAEGRVREIDRIGNFQNTILVWSDPDNRRLYVVDGRGNLHDVREVNRRRRERGDKPMKIRFTRFQGTLEEAAEHVRLRNFHRKKPTLAHYGREVVRLNREGKSWERIAQLLDLNPPEEWGEKQLRKVATLAWCIEDVCAAVEAGKLSLAKARKFGGKALDGSERLGDEEQRALLAEMLTPREKVRTGPKPMPAAAVRRIEDALKNGGMDKIRSQHDRMAAEIARQVIARVRGEVGALKSFPELEALFATAESPDKPAT